MPVKKVLVWDLDETLIIFQSLLDGSYGQFSGDPSRCSALAVQWEDALFNACVTHLLYTHVEDCDQTTVNSLLEHDDGADLTTYQFYSDGFKLPVSGPLRLRQLAYRYRHLRRLYSQGIGDVLSVEEKLRVDRLYEATDKLTNGWLSSGVRLLESLGGLPYEPNQPEYTYVNVVVTSGQLVPTLAKLMLFKLNRVVHSSNVYSSRNTSKLSCFRAIRERFLKEYGDSVEFIAIGDSSDEERAARTLNWRFECVSFKSGRLSLNNLDRQRIEGSS